jgi:hypothetical protein
MPFFLQAQWWEGIAGNIAAAIILMLVGYLITKAAKLAPTIRDNSSDSFKFGLEITIAVGLALLAYRIAAISIPTQMSDPVVSNKLDQIQAELSTLKTNESARLRYVWPTLTSAQVSLLSSRLSKVAPKETFVVTCNDANCDAFAIQLAELMSRSGFPEQGSLGSSISGIGDGISVIATDQDSIAPQVRTALQDILGTSAQVHFSALAGGIVVPSEKQLIIVIGVRR